MARKLAIRRCDPREGVTVEQVKDYIMRKGVGHAIRMKYTLPRSTFRQSGRKVIARNDSEGSTTTYGCSMGSRIYGEIDYDDRGYDD